MARSRFPKTCWPPGAASARAAPRCARRGKKPSSRSRRHKQAEFKAAIAGTIPGHSVGEALTALKKDAVTSKPKLATRQSSGKVLEAIFGLLPELIGGSADLTPSNNTKVKNFPEIARGSFGGRYIHYGIREFGMCAAMNGMALHGGIIPYGGTFMCFSDYARPAIRLASLMKQRVVFVMTHDSIGLGEDGPTHQPVEHLAALRAIPHLLTMRPADLIETAECWELAIAHNDRPSLLALSRQGVPALRDDYEVEQVGQGRIYSGQGRGQGRCPHLRHRHRSLRWPATPGAAEGEGHQRHGRVDPLLQPVLRAGRCLSRRGASAARDLLKVGIEAAVRFGWDSIIGQDGIFIGMKGFGDSGPAP